jgi:hypothetical protein
MGFSPATIAGNHDAKVNKLTASELAEQGKNYAYGLIGEDEKNYLATLPAHIRLVFRRSCDKLVAGQGRF